ncbi:unnamed protein product [Medioppia subpectinata]|uniref:Uncharacterized protein n=1 Tax=Medioppia subpectinata TaxID=1979941 RepID=A0A7R9KQH6_9ACAR|nr:unnamed protein product [Medioppia subpectinata]CAG2107539.1 unnamed protein product [Medioppia subpectinata]
MWFLVVSIRVWIRRREEAIPTRKEEVQELGYRDYVPDRKEGDKIETLDEVINRINAIIRDGKFEGRIVSIECLPCESTGDHRFDPEATLPGSSDTTVTIVRIYYECGQSSEEEIGIADFVPLHLSGGSLFSRPEFETFDHVMTRASRWLSENPEINFRSALSIDFKLKSMTTLDTRILTATDQAGDFVRIFRIAYTKPFDVSEDIERSACLPPLPPIYLYSRMFLLKSRNYADLKKVISDWYNTEIAGRVDGGNNCVDTVSGNSGSGSGSGEFTDIVAEPSTSKSKCQLLSCETLSVFAKNQTGFEESFNSNRVGARNRCTFIAVRLYYDSGYHLNRVRQSGVNNNNNIPHTSCAPKLEKKSSSSCDIS